MKLAAQSHSHAVFSSVFPVGTVPPPRRRNRSFEKDFTLTDITTILRNDGRYALGIGREKSMSGFLSAGGNTFHPFYPKSGYTAKLVPETVAQHRQHMLAWSKLGSWQQSFHWKEVYGLTALEKAFAVVIDGLVTDFIRWSYAESYENSVLSHLRFWVENILIRYVSGYLNTLQGQKPLQLLFDQNQVQKWHDLALTRLAILRTAELFDVVVDWESTAAAVDDLKQFATNPATRSYITTDFAEVLTTRLLHPGASTIEILSVYISVIRAFRRLDPKGVLLERVVRKIRRYLRDREDTIKVVVAGLLADPSSDSSTTDPDVLHELAHELHQHSSPANKTYDADLDFNNMDWQPDPVDAAPDYLKSKSTDILSSLITLFDSKDTFIKELQITLADRLLKNRPDFDQEISVIEHLKIRFGDSALQGCEVMLRDVLDSRKVNQVIRQDQAMDQIDRFSTLSDVQLHTKVLSRLFWPSLQEQNFRIPIPVQHQQALYEKGFENLKQSRKLTWLNAIGQVEIELELEDRTFQDEVLPWQASVIYAFQDLDISPGSRSISELAAELEMVPSLVRSACMFWSSKRILIESSRDIFTVLESLPSGSDLSFNDQPGGQDADSAAAEMAAAQAAREAEEAERKQKMSLYHQFIVSMLTNQGAMPLPRIAMMLGIVVPGGFPFGNEELKEFLDGMVKNGVLQIGAGGNYKAVK